MGKRQLPYIQAYTVCIISNSILYFGGLHDGKQLMWSNYSGIISGTHFLCGVDTPILLDLCV